MICVPETLSNAFRKTPMIHELDPLLAPRVAQTSELSHGVDAAPCAYAVIAEENLLAQIGGLRPKLPFMNAKLRAKRKTSWRHLERTPTA